MIEMTSKERLKAALNGKPVDRLPFAPNIAYVWDFYPESIRRKGQEEFLKEVGADQLLRGTQLAAYYIQNGVEVKTTNDGNKTFVDFITPVGSIREGFVQTDATRFLSEHPLKTEEDYKILLWIEENTTCHYSVKEANEHLQNSNSVLSIGQLIPRCKSAFQSLIEHFAGTEELTYALVDFPDTVEELLAKMIENDIKLVKMAAESNYEYFLTWEDSSTQNYSPAMYDKYIASEIKQWCDVLHGAGKKYVQHACGHVKDILPMMKASGADVIESFVSPPTGNISIRDARTIAGKEMGIIGGIEPISFLTLDNKALADFTELAIEDLKGGPFILANGDSCPPGVTPEKFKLVADIARNYKVGN